MVTYVICAMGGPNYPLECRICLWIFESKSELEIHNYLEHMIMNHAEHNRIIQDAPCSRIGRRDKKE